MKASLLFEARAKTLTSVYVVKFNKGALLCCNFPLMSFVYSMCFCLCRRPVMSILLCSTEFLFTAPFGDVIKPGPL